MDTFRKINCNEKITNVRASEVEKVILREVQNGYKFLYKEDEIPIMAIGCDTEIEVFYTLVLKKLIQSVLLASITLGTCVSTSLGRDNISRGLLFWHNC